MDQEKNIKIQEGQPLLTSPNTQTEGPILQTIENENLGENSKELITFDEVLTKVGQGKYQFVIYIVMALIGMTEGSQITIFTLTIPILKHQWDVEEHLNTLQASLVFCGFLIGSLMSGQVADRYGRKVPFLISTCLTMIITILTALATNIYQLIIIRLIMGTLVGFFGPLTMTLLAEITPQQLRGRYMSLVTISVSIGQLFALVSGYFILDNLKDGNWRLLIFVTVIPGLLSWFVIVFWLDESARYLLCSKEYEKSFKILQRMNDVNGGVVFKELSDRDKNGMINWSNKLNEKFKNEDKASISALFQGDLKVITPIVWANLCVLSFVYFGLIILLPSLLDEIAKIQSEVAGAESIEENNDMTKLIITAAIEMFAGVLASIMIEIQGFGRKNSMINFGIIQGITFFLVYYDNLGRFIFWVTLAKFYQIMNYAFSYQFITEVYGTKIRTTGIGMANSIGRSGGIFLPWIIAKLQDINLLAPFLLFSALSLIMSLVISFLPFDTLGRDIDQIEDEDEKVKDPTQAKQERIQKLASQFITEASPQLKQQNSLQNRALQKFKNLISKNKQPNQEILQQQEKPKE